MSGIMERVSSATAAAEVEDAISTDQSGRSGKRELKFGHMLTRNSLMEWRRLSASIVSFSYLLCQGKEQLI